MKKFDEIGRELEKSGRADDIKRLAQSEDGQRLAGMVDGKALEKAAREGDGEALKRALGSVLSTEEGRRLAENVRKMMGK